MSRQGVRLLTLAGDPDPERLAQLLSLVNQTLPDIPHTAPIPAKTKEGLRQLLAAPQVREERFWIARLGGELVGLSYLYYPPRRGHVRTFYTATARAHRGRGIARAVKMETLSQAIELGVRRVRTDNDEQNLAMLHINQRLGYRPLAGSLTFLRRL